MATATDRFGSEDNRLGKAIASGTGTAFIPAVMLTDATGTIGGTTVQGNVAAGTVDSGNPVKIGGLVNSSAPAGKADGQRVDAWYTDRGAQNIAITTGGVAVGSFSSADAQSNTLALVSHSFSYGYNGTTWDRLRGDTNGMVVQPALSANFWRYAGASGGIVSSTADVALAAAAGASVRNYIKSLSIAHDVLSAVTECVVKDGSTVIWRGKLQTPVVDSSAGAGTIIFDPPLRGTANTALNFALITSVTGGVFVNAQGYTGA